MSAILLPEAQFLKMLKPHKKVRPSTWQGKAHRALGKTAEVASASTSTAAAAAARQARLDEKAGKGGSVVTKESHPVVNTKDKDMITISIKELGGSGDTNPVDMVVNPKWMVSMVKQHVSRHCSIPVSQQKLVCKGKVMANDKRLNDYKVAHGAKIHVQRIKGTEASSSSSASSGAGGDQFPFLQNLKDVVIEHYTQEAADRIMQVLLSEAEQGNTR